MTPHRLERIRLGLLLSALRWRLGSSVVFFLIALLAVAAATGGPVYLAAADQSVLQHVVAPVAPEDTGLVATALPGQGLSQTALRQAFAVLPRSPSGRRYFESPIYTEDAAGVLLSKQQKPTAVADVIARSSDCRHLVFVAGGCPGGSRQIAISTRSATYLHLRLGQVQRLAIAGFGHRYRIVGLYRAGSASDPYWWGTDFFRYGTAECHPPRATRRPVRRRVGVCRPGAGPGGTERRRARQHKAGCATEIPAFRPGSRRRGAAARPGWGCSPAAGSGAISATWQASSRR